MSESAVATCENHLQREAIGVCVRCRTRVCSECSTKVEGINYCVRCLSGLARHGRRRSAPEQEGAGGGAAYLAAAGYLLVLSLSLWLLLEVILPGGGAVRLP